ncbi:HdeD family acid-resistance protein [Microbaculum sp. FT89]|uniref:HdeD family acid-resistance protein n=1 Tax=Microbaculum sp. FT89 TaxID=3447298 RepID=UPI003F531808
MSTPEAGLPTREELAAQTRDAIRKHRTLFLVQGIVMVILGIVAIVIPQVTTLAATIFVGWLFVIGGIIRVVATFQSRSAPGFWWSLLIGILALIVGFIIVANPLKGVLTLTMALIILFLVEGVFQFIAGIEFRKALASSWVWLIISGVIDIALAVLIFAGWPDTATWAIGLLVGINLLFAGIALTMTALAAKDLPAT